MINRTLAQAMQNDRGRLLAALIARTGDFQRAEDALQEAAASALTHWGRAGVPASPTGWLLRAALRKAIDAFRSDTSLARHRDAIAVLAREEAADPDPQAIPDDRLRLIFTCCHPALEEKTRVALTLRSLCGLTTAQVAAVFLDAEPTMGQRLSRAKTKISAAGIPFAIPGPEDWPDRLNSILTVIYLIFTTGYAQGPQIGIDLCTEAIFLVRLVHDLAPEQPEVEGCLALLLLTDGRAPARTGPEGKTLPPAQQDRSLWNRAELSEGRSVLDSAIARCSPGPFQIKAAIAALHAAETGPDWPQIAALYGRLRDFEPTPVIALNHAVAIAEAGDPAGALAQVQSLAGALETYQPFHAALADLLVRTGRTGAARSAYAQAIALAGSASDRAFLQARLATLD
jgi:RNA polymerase sigma factor (sigma-70 family)